MKTLLPLILSLAMLQAGAQELKPAVDFGPDQATALNTQSKPGINKDSLARVKYQEEQEMGTSMEQSFQETSKMNSSHHSLVYFVGAKVYWLNELSIWLQTHGYGYIDAKSKPGLETWSYYVKSSNGGKLIVAAKTNPSNNRIKSLTISGPADDVIKCFVRYWNSSNISLNELKRGGYIFQDYNTDRVAFDWKGSNPKITVFKRPSGNMVKVFPE